MSTFRSPLTEVYETLETLWDAYAFLFTKLAAWLALASGISLLVYGLAWANLHREAGDRTVVLADLAFVSAGATIALAGITIWYARESWLERVRREARETMNYVYSPLIAKLTDVARYVDEQELTRDISLLNAVGPDRMWMVEQDIALEYNEICEGYRELARLEQEATWDYERLTKSFMAQKNIQQVWSNAHKRHFAAWAVFEKDQWVARKFLRRQMPTDSEMKEQQYSDSPRGEFGIKPSDVFGRPEEALADLLEYCWENSEKLEKYYDRQKEVRGRCEDMAKLLKSRRLKNARQTGIKTKKLIKEY